MVVVMSPDATDEDVAHVVEKVESVGGEAFVSKGVVRTIIGLVGDLESFHGLNLRTLRGVADVHRISDPYKLVSRQHHPDRSTVWVGRTRPHAGADRPRHASPSWPARARSSRPSRRSRRPGWPSRPARRSCAAGPTSRARRRTPSRAWASRGLEILADVREATGMPVVTEVVDARDVPVVAEHADMLQIGTRNMANFGLLQAAGDAGKPVLLKRGMTATIEEWLMAAEYIAQRGNLDVVLCERGIRTFEPSTRNTLDISAVPVVQATSHLPIIVDPSHAAGRKDLVVPALARRDRGRRRRHHRRRPPRPRDGAVRRAAGPARHRAARPRAGLSPAARGRGPGRAPTSGRPGLSPDRRHAPPG